MRTEPTDPLHDVEIIRDRDGIAHVRAGDPAGAFAGQGFASAEDRLWQMDADRRRALGRLAEVVGPSAIPLDTFHRRMGLADAARRSFDLLGAEAQGALIAYAAGVNRHLSERQEPPREFVLLGYEPEPWEPWHSVAVYQVRHLAMGTFETKVWRSGLVHRLGPQRVAALWPDLGELPIEPGSGLVHAAEGAREAMAASAASLAWFAEDAASNNLAVAPTQTSTGRPLVAGDPHRAIDLPNVYWQNHLTCVGDGDADGFDVIGLSFPGVPGHPHFGHNDDVAWCITHGMADDQDLYVLDVREAGDGGGDYRYDGAWRPLVRRTETIDVAGAEPVTVVCEQSHHGPVVAGEGRARLALRWTALAGPDHTFDALVPMLRARSVSELDDAFEPWVVPVNNVLMADTTGAIAYRMRGRLAVRSPTNGWTAVPGDDPARDWSGFVPDQDLPRWRDPDEGFLVTANNRISEHGPYVSHDFAHPARAIILWNRLSTEHEWNVDRAVELLRDHRSPVAAVFYSRLRGLRTIQATERRALETMDGWDFSMDANSAPAAVYGTVRAELVGILLDRLGLVDDRLPGISGPSLHQTMRFVNARLAVWIEHRDLVPDDALASALRLAVRRLELDQGPDPSRWSWGVAHKARFVHPLVALRPDLEADLPTPPAVRLGGDNECVWATSTAPPSTEASNAQVARYVFDVGNWDASVWVVPHGVSGDARSPHHLDQLADWTTGRMRPMRFSREAVAAAKASVRTF